MSKFMIFMRIVGIITVLMLIISSIILYKTTQTYRIQSYEQASFSFIKYDNRDDKLIYVELATEPFLITSFVYPKTSILNSLDEGDMITIGYRATSHPKYPYEAVYIETNGMIILSLADTISHYRNNYLIGVYTVLGVAVLLIIAIIISFLPKKQFDLVYSLTNPSVIPPIEAYEPIAGINYVNFSLQPNKRQLKTLYELTPENRVCFFYPDTVIGNNVIISAFRIKDDFVYDFIYNDDVKFVLSLFEDNHYFRYPKLKEMPKDVYEQYMDMLLELADDLDFQLDIERL